MDISGLPILSIITFLPLVGALLIAMIPRGEVGLIRAAALGTSLLAWALSLLLLVGFLPSHPGFQFVERHEWIPVFGIQYKMGIDGLSLVLVVLTTTLTWISVLASFKPISDRVKEYMISFLILEVGMIGVFCALDLFLFYVFFEVVLVPMYLIIGIWGGRNRIYATIKFVLYTLVGSLLMLVAILATAFEWQAGHGGNWAGAFDYEALRAYGFDSTFQLFAFGAFFLAFAIKLPMFPFHTWLPDAHVEAPTAGSVMLAAILLKLGGYGFIRFAVPLFPEAARTFGPLIIVLSLIAIIYGAIVALVQPDLKKLVAYSSVSHMGFVTLGIFVFQEQGLQGAILQMVNHGLITGALFLLVGVIYERVHDRSIAKMGGLVGRHARLCRRVRLLPVRLRRVTWPVGLRRRVPGLPRGVRVQPGGRGRGHLRDDLRGLLPALDVPADLLRRPLGVPARRRPSPHGPHADRADDPGAARDPRDHLRPVPGPRADPRPGHGQQRHGRRERRQRRQPHVLAVAGAAPIWPGPIS